ncbi:MAG: N-acetylglutaminylglutamine amidotransferase [Planctomycetota bacterium]|nr:MAG: N-acetylglutaminylglutamine amidotransferase [Planctomycetota bacterium]
MCGIAGELRFDRSLADAAAVTRMMERMVMRGPDGSGVLARGSVALGHRRLKIIDLSERAQQPMIDAQLGLNLVFNGCIYNHHELRSELEGLGYRFFSQGDTEVILKAWHAWGAESVKRFNGMFACAIHERDSGRVHLLRDRLGIKPLYLDQRPGMLRFASSLPALLAAGGVDTDIDGVGLHHYMSFHAVVPAPQTILKGVRKLPPATIATIEADGRMSTQCYWRPTFATPEDRLHWRAEDWEEAVMQQLRQAVKRRLVADVEVGVLLSGGLDSSLIVGLLAEAGQGLQTFSIGFESVGEERGDEFQYSDIIAQHFGTQHHQIFVHTDEFLPNLPKAIGAMNEPMVSHDNIGFFLLSREVAKHVKVVQSGQGADEIHAGYRWYPPLLDTDDALACYRQHFFDRSHEEFCADVHPRFHAEDYSGALVAAHFAQPGAEAAVDKALRLDTTIMLVDDPVKRVDSQTMAWGLEARVPFLDHEFVELSAQVPGHLKCAEDGKGILKQGARKIIPASVIDRPKGYFPVPALKYLRGPYLELVRDSLHSQAARQRGIFNPQRIDEMLAKPDEQITPLQGSKLWQCALLELWLQEQGI